MKLGLVADIHESVENLRCVLGRMNDQAVDKIFSLGDFCESGTRLEATCELLLDAEVQGVWGNHDYGICMDAHNGTAGNYGFASAEFASRQQPYIWCDECLLMHIEPWLDPHKINDLWFFDSQICSAARRQRIFSRKDFTLAIMGHYHRWWAVSEEADLNWSGKEPLELPDARCLAVVNACCDGYWATFDTKTRVLTPFSLAD